MSGSRPAVAADTVLDLSSFTASVLSVDASVQELTSVETATVPALVAPRLVDPATLGPEHRQLAETQAASIDFTNATTTLAFVDQALQPVAQISRQILADTRVGDMGEVGGIAASVIDGIRILRIEELQQEVAGTSRAAGGFLSKVMSLGRSVHSALQGFAENRKKFLTLMDKEEARARRAKGDLTVTVSQLDDQAAAIRRSIGQLGIGIAAAQLALDRGYAEYEVLRQAAIASNSPADAAIALDRRNTLVNFAERIADLREAMVSAATLVPIIATNRKAAETRIGQLSSGILLTLPRLMALASQAVVQADIRRAGEQGDRLAEADRKVMGMIGAGAHQAALDTARSQGGDPRRLDALADLAKQTITTMDDVLTAETEAARQQAANEQRLIAIKNDLVEGMTRVRAKALSAPLPRS